MLPSIGDTTLYELKNPFHEPGPLAVRLTDFYHAHGGALLDNLHHEITIMKEAYFAVFVHAPRPYIYTVHLPYRLYFPLALISTA